MKTMNIGCMVDTESLSNEHSLRYSRSILRVYDLIDNILYIHIYIYVFCSNEQILKHTVYLSTKITLITLKE